MNKSKYSKLVVMNRNKLFMAQCLEISQLEISNKPHSTTASWLFVNTPQPHSITDIEFIHPLDSCSCSAEINNFTDPCRPLCTLTAPSMCTLKMSLSTPDSHSKIRLMRLMGQMTVKTVKIKIRKIK
jgi:hypothetical protein